MVCAKLKEIVNLQDIIKNDGLNYKSKRGKVYNFSEYSLPIIFLKDIHGEYSSLEEADDEQSKFDAKFKKIENVKKQLRKSFLKIF